MSFFMPARRSTSDLLQASGELWVDEGEVAPLHIAVLAPDDAVPALIDALLAAAGQLAPDDVTLHRVTISGLPDPADPAQEPTGTIVPAAVAGFRDGLAAADGFLLVDVLPDPSGSSLPDPTLRAIRWAGTPVGDDALTGLAVAWLPIGADPAVQADRWSEVAAAVTDGGGVPLTGNDGLVAPLAGDLAGRLGADGRLDDLPARQAVGQLLIRLREAVLVGASDQDREGGEPDDGPDRDDERDGRTDAPFRG